MTSLTEIAPIVLFVYNRPDHTRKTLDALSLNYLASESILYIYSDAAKSNDNLEKVLEVRMVIEAYYKCFRDVIIIKRNSNFGLAANIIDGVTDLVNKYGKVIVLEDDLITSNNFLRFMNTALSVYEKDEKIMHISGAIYPINTNKLTNTFFLRLPLCWGWATWKRAWVKYEKSNEVVRSITRKEISYMDFCGAYRYSKQLSDNLNGKIDTWFIFWYLTVIRHEGLCLFPFKSLVKNIGHDGSGTHCAVDEKFNIPLHSENIAINKVMPKEDILILFKHLSYFIKTKPSFLFKLLMVFRVIKNWILFCGNIK